MKSKQQQQQQQQQQKNSKQKRKRVFGKSIESVVYIVVQLVRVRNNLVAIAISDTVIYFIFW